jgi:hypothetical protein
MNPISRRRFLQGMLAAGLLPLQEKTDTSILGRGLLQTTGAFTRQYLDALESPHLALLNDLFYAVSDERTVSFILYDLSHDRLLAAMEPENPLPVASAFKSGVLMMFINLISPLVWNSVPVDYWHIGRINQVPTEYQDAWSQYRAILNDLYDMIVVSDNFATGRVMAYIADWFGSNTPLALFNDWSRDVVGISHLSGLSRWYFAIPDNMSAEDPRFFNRDSNIDHVPVRYHNLMTARDLGLYYTWFLDQMPPEQQLVCGTLLTITLPERQANVEELARKNRGMAFSKNGNLGLDDSPAGIVITDGGIVVHGDGTMYLVSFLSVNAEYQAVPAIFQRADEVLKGYHNETIQANFARNQKETATFDYDAFLQNAYPYEGVLVYDDQYNYAFVRREGISVYSQPAEGYEVRNPVISASRFGVHLLMQGALVRYIPVDATWAELIPDDTTDNVKTRLAERVFVKRADLWTISYEHVRPIDYFIDPAISPDQKYVVINVQQRELSLLEVGNVVIKTPIALNLYATPRGSYPIMTRWFARSMQAWAPGVPFTTFFHYEGYALHGAPWQRWEATVNQQNLLTRISAGCVNLPNWMVELGYHKRPLDELVFRWLGGLEHPESEIREFAQGRYGALRVYVVDTYADLLPHSLPIPVARTGVIWDDVIANITYVPLTAPPSFFV